MFQKFPFMKLIILYAILINGLSFAHTAHNNQENDSKEELDYYLEKIEHLLSKTSADAIIYKMVSDRKLQFIREMIDKPEETVDQNLKPTQPKLLTEEEKQINIYERIGKKYIGELPGQIRDMIFFFTNHEKCLKNDIELYNRILLYGKPGTGKTYLFQVIAQELQLPSLWFSASSFGDKYIGESSKKIRAVFEIAKQLNKPILIFIDEIDAIATKRKDSTHEEHRATLITLLTELQDIQDNKNIFIIVATNDKESIDPALTSRFGLSICEIKEHTADQRAQLFKKFFAEKKVIIDDKFAIRLAEVAYSPHFSNRDIQYIVMTALAKRFAACEENAANCNKHMCSYVRKAMDSTEGSGKKGSFHYWRDPEYCDGI